MRKATFAMIILLVFWLIMPGIVTAEEILVVTDEWKGYLNDDGTGYFIDIIRAVYEPDHKIVIKKYPYMRSLMMVRGGIADIVLGIYKEDLPDWVF